MITWRARTEVEQLRDLQQSCVGMLGGAFLLVILVLSVGNNSTFQLAAEIIAILGGGFSFWMILQLRQAKRAINQS